MAPVAGEPGSASASIQEGLSASGGAESEVLDTTARAAYRERLEELREELEEAERLRDAGRIEQVQNERAFLERELSGAAGLGGRARRTPGPEERARKAVYNRIRHVVRGLRDVHPELADHLSSAIRTGTACVYHPSPTPNWRLD